jgi:hypothetical protein
MSFDGWSWQSYFLGVISALFPSALATLWFAWRAPVIDDETFQEAESAGRRQDDASAARVVVASPSTRAVLPPPPTV